MFLNVIMVEVGFVINFSSDLVLGGALTLVLTLTLRVFTLLIQVSVKC